MEKALNILKDLCIVLDFNSYWKPRVDEAIAELEETQLNRREWYQKGYSEAMKHHEAHIKAKDEEIEMLQCRLYHAEGYIKDIHEPKNTK